MNQYYCKLCNKPFSELKKVYDDGEEIYVCPWCKGEAWIDRVLQSEMMLDMIVKKFWKNTRAKI